MEKDSITLSAQVLRMFLTVDRKHRCAIERQMQHFGIHRSQHMLLMYLSHRSVPPTQKDIADEFGISPATVAVTLQKLNAAGLIEQLPRKGNSRANDIRLTQAGADIVKQSDVLVNEINELMCAGITDEELSTLLPVLTKMSENLDGAHASAPV